MASGSRADFSRIGQLLLSAAAFAWPIDAAAQGTISGSITDRDTHEPIAGAVISAINAAQKPVARVVTSAAGKFGFVLPADAKTLQFRRIGYSALDVSITDSVRASGRLDIAAAKVPTLLPRVVTNDVAVCDARDDRATALAIWDQARSGLLASIVARTTLPTGGRVVTFRRAVTIRGEPLQQSTEVVERTSMARPFGSARSIALFATNGYRADTRLGVEYFAPDDEILFDDSFLETHCLSMADVAKDSAGLIGLRFEPASGRDKLVEIEGTMWLNKDPLDLRSVDYRYTGVTRDLVREGAGGSIGFRRMPNGVTMMDRFSIRAAGREIGSYTENAKFKQPIVHVGAYGAQEYYELGGRIDRLNWSDGTTWTATDFATLGGRVRERGTDQGIASIEVSLVDTPVRGLTDDHGAFQLSRILPGQYKIQARDTLLARFGVRLTIDKDVDVSLDRQIGSVDLEPPSRNVAADRACHDKDVPRADVKNSSGRGVALFRTTLSNDSGTKAAMRAEVWPAGAKAGSAPIVVTGTADAAGLFRVCRIPESRMVVVATTPNGSATAELIFGKVMELKTQSLVIR